MLFQTICKGFPITLRVQNLKNFPPPAVNLQLRIPPLNKFLETIRGGILIWGVFLARIPLIQKVCQPRVAERSNSTKNVSDVSGITNLKLIQNLRSEILRTGGGAILLQPRVHGRSEQRAAHT